MRKITAFYCLSYPDDEPEDPAVAASEVYVEFGDENATLNCFEATVQSHALD